MNRADDAAGWRAFAEKVRLAHESSMASDPDFGTSGLELEFNVVDENLQPVEMFGVGPERRSFADVLRDELLPPWARDRFKLEVFSWMIEATTRPQPTPAAAVAEARLLEAVLLNTLANLELAQGERLYLLHGNIPRPLQPTEESIPDGWELAHRRYLARCVSEFGSRLATAGIHTNHSLPEALVSWDYFHLPAQRRNGIGLEDFRNEALIRATRSLRPYCALFIAISAASPLCWCDVHGTPEIILDEFDSHRLLTFPNPPQLDLPGLYASHREYLRISYDLVRSGVRIGANNWTPVRARSGVEPVARNIQATSEQLRELYRRGIYTVGERGSLEEAERQLTVENLCARVDLPMNRVEVRTDEGGDSLELATAKVALKELLLLSSYARPELGSSYRYDARDVAVARDNEAEAAKHGLRATVIDPFTRERVSLREQLTSLLGELAPLAEALDVAESLVPLQEMARGGPSPAEEMRRWFRQRLRGGATTREGHLVVPAAAVREWLDERRRLLAADVARIADDGSLRRSVGHRLQGLVDGIEEQGRGAPDLPVQISRAPTVITIERPEGRAGDVVELAARLIQMPSVTNCPDERIDEVERCVRFAAGLLREGGLHVKLYEDGPYPALLAGFADPPLAAVTLGGHLDVVAPDPDDSQFEPRVEGDYLWGRGAADMKTVDATFMVWLRGRAAQGPPFPSVNLLLVGNEENGESEPWGTPHVLEDLRRTWRWQPELMVLGERTGERGDEMMGAVCTANRGVVRLRVIARGHRMHTGMGGESASLLDRLLEARGRIDTLLRRHLTLAAHDGWHSAAKFPFLNVGETGVYNITPAEGVLGLEVRPIPGDEVLHMVEAVAEVCRELGLELVRDVEEPGVACPAGNRRLRQLLDAVAKVGGAPADVGRKLAGTSARFAPRGNAVVWGQSGIGPHSRDERHFIPSIEPYLRVLDELGVEVTDDTA